MALLQGTTQLVQRLHNAEWIGISVISQIEFLAFTGLGQSDRQLFQQFLQRVEVIGLFPDNTELIEEVITIRQQARLKLPDAVIAAITRQNSACLVTADRDFSKVATLTVVDW